MQSAPELSRAENSCGAQLSAQRIGSKSRSSSGSFTERCDELDKASLQRTTDNRATLEELRNQLETTSNAAMSSFKSMHSELQAKLAAHGAKAVAIQGDVSDAEEAQGMVRQTIEQLGGIEILVNSAGSVDRATSLSSTIEGWRVDPLLGSPSQPSVL